MVSNIVEDTLYEITEHETKKTEILLVTARKKMEWTNDEILFKSRQFSRTMEALFLSLIFIIHGYFHPLLEQHRIFFHRSNLFQAAEHSRQQSLVLVTLLCSTLTSFCGLHSFQWAHWNREKEKLNVPLKYLEWNYPYTENTKFHRSLFGCFFLSG